MSKKIIYSYLAGLIDGEGSINITLYKTAAGNVRWRPSIKVCMTDQEPIELFSQTYGFKIYRGETKKGRTTYSCEAAWRGCKAILDTLIPYLRGKKNQALLVREFCQHVEDYRSSPPPFKRNAKGHILSGSLGNTITHEEFVYRHETYLKVKQYQHQKSNTIHRKRLSEEARASSEEFWMRQSELMGNEPLEATEMDARPQGSLK